jgi:tetratricopeptide (TPR) repeat protein
MSSGLVTLRLTQSIAGVNRYRVEVDLTGDGLAHQISRTEFDFAVGAQDREDLRWYLEDYLQYAADPAPKIAARIERRMAEIGTDLFKALFHFNDDTHNLWEAVRPRLNDTRIEIVTDVRDVNAVPWELLRDPKVTPPLALRAQAFVRAAHRTGQKPRLPNDGSGPIRILLVICRPGGGNDVPFRSVAGQLIRGSGQSPWESVAFEVLRPPTFAQLRQTLRVAKYEGKPYQGVHFDGHGIYDDLNARYANRPPVQSRGYLAFENSALPGNEEFVHGELLGKILAEADVPLLVLNACRSAHAEAPSAPRQIPASEADDAPIEGEPQAPARVFGSLAQEVINAGVDGVVAMGYNVYVVTAAQFVVDIYGALAEGLTLGEAVTCGRKQLHDEPLREIAHAPRPLQDWPVPIVHEAAPIRILPKRTKAKALSRITLKAGEAPAGSGDLDAKLPLHPDAGFFGRDETLLALDRAFDVQPIVLLHSYAGNGKTATAAEFARWYALTGGIDGPVLFTSFERYLSLAQVLDQVGQRFEGALQRVGIQWLAISDPERREVALQLLARVPVLWLWDNVESVAGFPSGAASAWSPSEQQELADFLRAARQTRAKFLLTSRRDERGWLGDLPTRIVIPPMPMQERVQFARALAEKHGRRLTEVENWGALLLFTGGNPLTLTVLVGQALRHGLSAKAQVEAFVAELRSGEVAFEDEASEGRSKSLSASLNYGFAHAFSEDERKQLALLHLFQGFVDVKVLYIMGHNPNPEWRVATLSTLTVESGLDLLDRAAEVGLLTTVGEGFYTIHPALPWFFKRLFDAHYTSVAGLQLSVARAFAEAIAGSGYLYRKEIEHGLAALGAEEGNLLSAAQLARTHGWWDALQKADGSLSTLYEHTGRFPEWARLADEIAREFVDPASGRPFPGREEYWAWANQFRVQRAREARNWVEAERLHSPPLEWYRKRALGALSQPPETWNDKQRHDIHSLATLLHELGQIQRESRKAECAASYEEAMRMAEQLGDRRLAATCAFNLGNAYFSVQPLHDRLEAERWFQRSLELYDPSDGLSRGKCFQMLGATAKGQFVVAQQAGRSREELLGHLNGALSYFYQALASLPPDAASLVPETHSLLGETYSLAGDFDRALAHLREGIRGLEAAGENYLAAISRFRVAETLAMAGRLADALDYAFSTLRELEPFGSAADQPLQLTQSLIQEIERLRTPGS